MTTKREKSMDWFYSKTEDEKIDLKNRHFPNQYIPFNDHFGFYFTFGQIEKMFDLEHHGEIVT